MVLYWWISAADSSLSLRDYITSVHTRTSVTHVHTYLYTHISPHKEESQQVDCEDVGGSHST